MGAALPLSSVKSQESRGAKMLAINQDLRTARKDELAQSRKSL